MKIVEIVKKDILESLKTLDIGFYSAFLEGYLRGCAEIKLTRDGFMLTITSDVIRELEAVVNIIVKLGGSQLEISAHQRQNIGNKFYYRADLSVEDSSLILKKCGISDGKYTIYDDISSFVKGDEEAAKCYIRGLFLATGSLSIPDIGSGKRQGYHLEMILSSEKSCDATIDLLKNIGICPHASKVERGYNVSVYVKSMEDISDFVAAMQSSEAVLRLQEVIVERDVRNNVNRSANCSIANLDKTIKANSQMVLDIMLIRDSLGLQKLPAPLQEVALARLKNPEMSLAELLEVIPNAPSKSGLQHRFQKLKEIAQDIRDKENKK